MFEGILRELSLISISIFLAGVWNGSIETSRLMSSAFIFCLKIFFSEGKGGGVVIMRKAVINRTANPATASIFINLSQFMSDLLLFSSDKSIASLANFLFRNNWLYRRSKRSKAMKTLMGIKACPHALVKIFDGSFR